jgi:hypothetical protein
MAGFCRGAKNLETPIYASVASRQNIEMSEVSGIDCGAFSSNLYPLVNKNHFLANQS